ncbi:MAG: MFS transporter [Dehalococcoidia bacterium]|nr:MFS transporter [Dehalococcoidia bacterium]
MSDSPIPSLAPMPAPLEVPPRPPADPAMARNLRLMPWWWVLRWTWFGEAIWVVYLLEERGLTIGQVFLFEASFSAVVIAAEIPTGVIADRFSRRLSLLLGTGATILAMFAFGLSTGPLLLLFAYLLFGLGEAFVSGADAAMLFDSLKRLGRDAEFPGHIGRYNALLTAAIALFTVAGAAMVQWTPLAAPILLSGLLSMPALFFAWRMSEPPPSEERAPFLETGRDALRFVASTPAIWSVVLLVAFATVAVATMAVAQQPVVLDYGVPLWTLGLFVGAQMALAAVGSWVAAPLGRVLGLRHVLWSMPLVSALALLAGASGVPWLFPLFILPAFGWNVLYVHVTDYVSRRAPERVRATAVSVGSMVASVTSVVAGLGLAWLADRAGLGAALTAAAFVLCVLTAFAYLVWWRAGDHRTEPPAGAPDGGAPVLTSTPVAAEPTIDERAG